MSIAFRPGPHSCTAFCNETEHLSEPLYTRAGTEIIRAGCHIPGYCTLPEGSCIEVLEVLPAAEAPVPDRLLQGVVERACLLRFRFIEPCRRHPQNLLLP